MPATECTAVTSRDSFLVSSGRMVEQPLGQHGLACSRRPREQEVVTARGGDLQSHAGPLLPRHVRQIRQMSVALPGAAGEAAADARAGHHQPGQHGVGAPLVVCLPLVGHRLVAEHRDQLPQAPYPEDGDSGDQRRLARGLFRHDDLPVSGLRRGEYGRQHPAHRPHPAVEPQLTDHHHIGDGSRIDPLGRPQHRTGDGEIEPGSALRHRGRLTGPP